MLRCCTVDEPILRRESTVLWLKDRCMTRAKTTFSFKKAVFKWTRKAVSKCWVTRSIHPGSIMPFLDMALREPVLHLLGVWSCKANIWACNCISEKDNFFPVSSALNLLIWQVKLSFLSLFLLPWLCLRLPALSYTSAGIFNEVVEMSLLWPWLGWHGALEELEQKGLCLQRQENSLDVGQLWFWGWKAACRARGKAWPLHAEMKAKVGVLSSSPSMTMCMGSCHGSAVMRHLVLLFEGLSLQILKKKINE